MEWRHEVAITPLKHRFTRAEGISLWGSCFAQELYQHLYSQLYSVHFSPFGIMYNPISIAEGLGQVLEGKLKLELFQHDGAWHSPMHHGQYSHPERSVAEATMQSEFRKAKATLAETKLWVFTFGTAYIYENATEGKVVNNCHRLPATTFRRRRLSVEEIVATWQPLVHSLRKLGAEVLFTVSPIPHYRDGAHDSRLSKATLLLAIEQLETEGVHYFPSYEIQLDELRDYRFFQEDLAHPTPQAVRYILDRFSAFALQPQPDFDLRWGKFLRLMHHRVLSNDKEKVARHYALLTEKLSSFCQEINHPYLHELALLIEQHNR